MGRPSSSAGETTNIVEERAVKFRFSKALERRVRSDWDSAIP